MLRRLHPSAVSAFLALAAMVAAILVYTLRNYNPHALGMMPGPVQEVLNTPTLSGHDIAVNILDITGNQAEVGRWDIPGEFSYGPVQNEGDNTWYITLTVPINMKGIVERMGYQPQIETSTVSSSLTNEDTTMSFDDYIDIVPLPSQSFDRLYFDPDNHMATFAFKLDPYGQVMDESWDAVAVNS
jgi:hypothetical protein